MPRIIEYPRASLEKSMDLADSVDSLGGEASIHSAADKLGKKVSGAFRALMSGSKLFGLVEVEREQLSVTGLYRRYKLAYTEDEASEVLKEIALSPPLFADLLRRFAGREVPVFLDKILIREYEVHESSASRVHRYFEDALVKAGLVDAEGKIVTDYGDKPESNQNESVASTTEPDFSSELPKSSFNHLGDMATESKAGFSVNINGPGLNTVFNLEEEGDFVVVEAILNRIRNKLDKDEP